MGPIKELYDLINDETHSRYSQNTPYPLEKGDQLIEFRTLESIEIFTSLPYRESVIISTFNQENTRILYVGEDVPSMRKTLNSLKLPSLISTNLSERVFCIFNRLLKKDIPGALCLEQEIKAGKELEFEGILKKIVEHYKNSEESFQNFRRSLYYPSKN